MQSVSLNVLKSNCFLIFSLEKETEGDNQEKDAEQTLVKETDKSTSRTGQHPSQSALSSQKDRRSAKSPQRTDAAKEHKHPFALYGWGEKRTDTGSQKTHNVCASASAHEVSKHSDIFLQFSFPPRL